MFGYGLLFPLLGALSLLSPVSAARRGEENKNLLSRATPIPSSYMVELAEGHVSSCISHKCLTSKNCSDFISNRMSGHFTAV